MQKCTEVEDVGRSEFLSSQRNMSELWIFALLPTLLKATNYCISSQSSHYILNIPLTILQSHNHETILWRKQAFGGGQYSLIENLGLTTFYLKIDMGKRCLKEEKRHWKHPKLWVQKNRISFVFYLIACILQFWDRNIARIANTVQVNFWL